MTAQAKTPHSPSLEEIPARYADSMGGKAEFENVTTLVLRGTIAFPAHHLSGTTAEYCKAPDHFLAISGIRGYGTVRTVDDGKPRGPKIRNTAATKY